jgi:hypothetical protein
MTNTTATVAPWCSTWLVVHGTGAKVPSKASSNKTALTTHVGSSSSSSSEVESVELHNQSLFVTKLFVAEFHSVTFIQEFERKFNEV